MLCYGAGWLVGRVAVVLFLKQSTAPEIFQAEAERRARGWLVRLLPFVLFALLVSLLARVGVLILEVAAPQEVTVAVYSAAVETGTFMYIVAKSTDKLYLPLPSILIDRKDVAALRRGRRARWAWLGPIYIAFPLVVFVISRRILGLFGDEFVEGYAALCIIALATCVWTMASLEPFFLKYVHREKFVDAATAATVVAHIGLGLPLDYALGATGSLLSYALPVSALYAAMAVTADHELKKLEAATPDSAWRPAPLPVDAVRTQISA